MALPNLRNLVNSNAEHAVQGGGAALMSLITGGSKAEAAMTGLGYALAHKVLGPLALVAGVAGGALKGIYALTKGFATMGTASAGGMEKVQNQLRVMLKGLDAAKQRVRELQSFAVKSPFSLKDAVAGNRVMESMGRGALSTKEMMNLVGDAAAQAGTDFESMAVYVGRLYDGLAAGRPVGEVLFRLAELGVVSGQARTQLEQLQTSGANFAEVWAVVEGELKRSKGTMEYTSRTLEGLQQATADAQDQLQASFSMNFVEGQKEALQAQADTMKNLMPVADELGLAFSRIVNVTSSMGSKVAAWMTSFKAVQTVMTAAVTAVTLLTTSIIALSVAMGVTKGARLAATFLGLERAAAQAAVGVARLTRFMAFLVTGPGILLAAVLIGAATAFSVLYNRSIRAAEALKEYEGATKAMITAMTAHWRAVKNLDDLSKAYQKTLAELRDANEQEAQAAMDGDAKKQTLASQRVAALKEQLAMLDQINRAHLERPQFVVDTMSAVKGNQRATGQAEREAARAQMTPEARAADLAGEANDLVARREAAAREIAGQEIYGESGQATQVELTKNKTAQAAVAARMGKSFGEEDQNQSYEQMQATYAALAAEMKKLKAEEYELTKASLTLAGATGSEIAVMQEKIKVWDQFIKSEQDVADAEEALAQAKAGEDKDGQKQERVESLTSAYEEQKKTLEMLTRLVGESGMDAGKAQEIRAAIERKKQETGADIMNRPEEIAKRAQAEQERRAAEAAGGNAELDVKVAGAGLDGRLAAEQAALDADRQRLEIQARTESMDERIYAARRKLLEIDQLRLNTQKEIAKQERTGEFKAGGFDLRAQAARLGGRGDKMREMEEKAALAREEAGRKAREQALMDTGLSDEEAKRQTQAEFNRARMSREMDRQGSLLGVAMGERSVSDSMARIGGGGSTYGGGDIKAITDRLDKLIKAVEEQEGTAELRMR